MLIPIRRHSVWAGIGPTRSPVSRTVPHGIIIYNKAENHRLSAFCLYGLVAAMHNVLLGLFGRMPCMIPIEQLV